MRGSSAAVVAAVVSVVASGEQLSAQQVRSNRHPLSIAEALETTRTMHGWDLNPVFVSPDGKRYVVMLIQGDVKRDGVWAELLSGSLESLEAAAKPKRLTRLFTRARGSAHGGGHDGSSQLVAPVLNPPVWIDNERIALFWDDQNAVRQIITIHALTGKVAYLTHNRTDVRSFGLSRDGSVVYAADVAHSRETSRQLVRDGFVVKNAEVFGLLNGDVDGYGFYDWAYNNERFVASGSHAKPRRISVTGGGINRIFSRVDTKFSPDGKFAIVDGTPSIVPAEWKEYTNDYFRGHMLPQFEQDPDGGGGRMIEQLFIVNIAEATARPLLAAPLAPPGLPRTSITWSPDSRSVLVTPTFLPLPTSNPAGLSARAIAEIDIATGNIHSLPLDTVLVARIDSVEWLSRDTITLLFKDGAANTYARAGDNWLLHADNTPPRLAKRFRSTPQVRVELRQALNTPPALYAVEIATNRARLIRELNPKLRSDVDLGHVEYVSWKDPDGRDWTGRLYYPVGYVTGKRYPLVVQPYGYAAHDEFSIYGMGKLQPALGPGYALYLAQPLAGRGVAVLQIEELSMPGVSYTWREAPAQMAAYEAAIEMLVQQGIVDRTRVGIMGFSSLGWTIQYIVSQSDFPYAAAIAADCKDGSLLQSAMMSWRANYGSDLNGTSPFGPGMKEWLERSPALSAERVRTPIQFQTHTASPSFGIVLWMWEMFSRLRALKSPTEHYVLPDIHHGTHGLQNPTQILGAQGRALDWWLFWLKDEEDGNAHKAAQYAAWRQLKAQRDSLLKKPRPPRLRWTVSPER
jgi:hypothetical protein